MVVNCFQPILAIRMVLESIIPPNGDYTDRELEDIQEDVGYWNAGYAEITIARREVSSFPIPIKLYFRDPNLGRWNYGRSFVDLGLGIYGVVDLNRIDYFLYARGIDVARRRLHG